MEVVRGTASEVLARFTERKPVGECVIVLEGASAEALAEAAAVYLPTVENALREAMAGGLSERDAIREVAARLRRPRREVYAVAMAMKEQNP